ncbi:Foie gras liver health family 1-domain-containing protein [Phakopsora pachyrhizi]|nr:Foie gras liver health family 1-domain-containing protein [Phakopsora pachyrhizi]
METLPPEFLSHHRPLLFFAGIRPPTSPSDSVASQTKDQPTLTTNVSIQALCSDLRKVIAQRDNQPLVWDPRKPHETVPEFRVLLVDKAIKFPPRKVRPNSTTGSTNSVSHSPLSPLSVTSPLFPDGLMTPIWIRKHRDMIPSVFVLCLSLWEPVMMNEQYDGNGLGSKGADQSEVEQQSRSDLQLISEITERRRSTSERGIKLVVIILTSRQMLDNPSLDPRLSYIRKQSGLDSRASLFVLSPVPHQDILEFFNTLKLELYETSIDFYREHSRRVRRKRTRSSANASVHSTIYSQPGQPIIAPLGPLGWAVRSDYKLATFAEFRQEYEVALKSYEDCWEGLSQMFGSTAVLPPRTKRWAEAKVLIDCISIKICKLFLYSNEHSRAVHQFNRHIRRFRDLCNGWGIGEETYELWSWLSKQYTLFGDLVDIACRGGMRLPNLLPNQNSFNNRNSISSSTFNGTNLANVLVHPGFYYFQSAQCSVERREKFRLREASEQEMRLVAESENRGAEFQGSPALAHERKVDHAELIINLYTRAYEIFKSVGAARMTLFLAFKITLVHLDRKDYQTSIKFLERLINSHRNDNFLPVVENVLGSYQRCLIQKFNLSLELGTTSLSDLESLKDIFKLSFELMGRDRAVLDDSFIKESFQFMNYILNNPLKASLPLPYLISFDLSPQKCLVVQPQVAFWKSWIEFGDEIDFQILMEIQEYFKDLGISFASIDIQFTGALPITLKDEESQLNICSFQTIELGEVRPENLVRNFDLRIPGKSTWLISGRLRPTTVGKIALERMKICLKSVKGAPTIEFGVIAEPLDERSDGPRWVSDLEKSTGKMTLLAVEALQSTCQVQPRMARFEVFTNYDRHGFVDEERIIELSVSNQEEALPIQINVVVDLPSGFSDKITLENQISESECQVIDFGSVEPKGTVKKRLNFRPSSISGSREIRLNVEAKTVKESEAEFAKNFEQEGGWLDPISKVAVEIELVVEEPFGVDFKTEHFQESTFEEEISPISLSRPDIWKYSCRALVTAYVRCNSQVDLVLKGINFLCKNTSAPIRVLSSTLSLIEEGDKEIEFLSGTMFSVSNVIEIASGFEKEVLKGNLMSISWTRLRREEKGSEIVWHEKRIETRIDSQPMRHSNVITNLPSHVYINEPIELFYQVQNFDDIRTLDVFIEVESTEQWVYSGPSKIERLMVMPRSSRKVHFRAVPIVSGKIEGPRVQVFRRIYRHQGPNKSLLSAEIEMTYEDSEEEDDHGGDKDDGMDDHRVKIGNDEKVIKEFEIEEIEVYRIDSKVKGVDEENSMDKERFGKEKKKVEEVGMMVSRGGKKKGRKKLTVIVLEKYQEN